MYLKCQAIENGSEKKREEAGLEDPWESRRSMARASLSQCWGQGREDGLMGSGLCLESDSTDGPAKGMKKAVSTSFSLKNGSEISFPLLLPMPQTF